MGMRNRAIEGDDCNTGREPWRASGREVAAPLLTMHCRARAKQRNFSPAEIEYVLQLGA